MAIKFSSGPHCYDSPENAAEFLPYIYELGINPGEEIAIKCVSRKPTSVRLRLSYGRHYIKEQLVTDGDHRFAPYAALAAHVAIIVRPEFPAMVYVGAKEYFSEAWARLPETPLFKFFHDIDAWLARDTNVAFTKRWNPELDPSYIRAVEQFLKMRPGRVPTVALDTKVMLLGKT